MMVQTEKGMRKTLERKLELSAFTLRIIALLTMFCDHAAKTIFASHNVNFLLLVGRFAYPIFAYQLVEGYVHTKDLKSYIKKLLCFAVLSEIPFNLLAGDGTLFYPSAQNVLWTMLIGICVIYGMERMQRYETMSISLVVSCFFIVMCGYLAATYGRVDYAGPGILMIVLFYGSRQTKYRYWIELSGMVLINGYLLMGPFEVWKIGNREVTYSLQSAAILALIPIWLYGGKQGYHSRWFQIFCYGFYPLHMILLVMIAFAA